MMKVGYDLYSIDKESVFSLLQFVKSKQLRLLHLRYRDDMYFFYIPTYQRFLLKSFDGYLTYHHTVGLIKYILLFSHQFINIVGVISFFISVGICSYFIFDIDIIGTMPQVNQRIIKDLKKEQVQRYRLLKNSEQLNEILTDLKKLYKKDVEYLNIYQVGSVFHVEYTKRRQEQVKKDDYRNIYAKKDGMIASFDIDSGLIKVKKNDYVKKGDLLVENTIISTQNNTQIIPVEGKVYAYTFNQYQCSIVNKGQDQGEVFYDLLLKIRAKIPTDALIDKENVLQMTKTRSKITLKMHYTLLEDIGIKGEENEGSH